ncbi:MAG: hypothetical protein Kilf2KO_02340 [Rhodospirillales bacterium]
MRLRHFLEILDRVERPCGSQFAAYGWFRSDPLPGFGGLTARQLLRDGRAAHLHAYLDRIATGGYA